ncbi:MAG: 4-hydroxybenzoate octaprenyltransferase [Alphaproteobacteria bacterium]|nr:4-hydroxybenzoate octaprenyltransferase [Alphaproteobacteria bacterium]
MNLPLNTKPHSDIKQNTVWQTLLPEALHPYILLARLDRPIGIWLLLLPGLWSIALASPALTKQTLWIAALFTLGAIVMRAAGCVINDLWDKNLDAQVERTRQRPLAAGTLTPRQAIIFLGILLFTGLLILLQMNILTIALGILSLPLIIVYPLMKRITWWPQAFLGLTFNFGSLMGWSAITGHIELPAILLYIGGIFWTLGYDTIYAHQDKEDDALAGIKSTALKFGPRSKLYVSLFYAAAFSCFIAALLTATAPLGATTAPIENVALPVKNIPPLKLGGILLPLGYGLWKITQWQPDNPDSSLHTFKSSRNLGLIILALLIVS